MMPPRSLSRVLLVAGLAFVFGVGGVLAGSYVRRFVYRPSPLVVPAPKSLLTKGMAFPEVPLTGGDGRVLDTGGLREGGGCVFLFLDLECPPCGEMAETWQGVLSSGRPPGLRVVGVTNHPLDMIDEFKLDHRVAFPILQDAGKVFLQTYRVDRFPLEVVVGASGRIRSTSYDPASPVDVESLSRLLADAPP